MIKVYLCKNHGRWLYRWRVDGDPEPKSRYAGLKVGDRADDRAAKRGRKQLEEELNRAPAKQPSAKVPIEPKQALQASEIPTLGEWMVKWFADDCPPRTRKSPKLTLGTRYDYNLLLKNQIQPFDLANKRLNEIEPMDVENWKRQLMAHYGTDQDGRQKGWKRISMAKARITEALDWAIMNRKRTGVTINPALTIATIGQESEPVKPYDRQQLEKQIYPHTRPGFESALIMTLGDAGLRPSEALALLRTDFAFERDKIIVRASRTRWGRREQTKTRASTREVDMTPRLKAELRRYLSSNIGGHEVFRFHSGRPINWGNFTRRNWAALLARAKVEYRAPGQLRHTYATLKLQETSGDIDYVKDQMGHVSREMIYRIYSAWLPSTAAAAGSTVRHLPE